jgi:hypothetical protein
MNFGEGLIMGLDYFDSRWRLLHNAGFFQTIASRKPRYDRTISAKTLAPIICLFLVSRAIQGSEWPRRMLRGAAVNFHNEQQNITTPD